MQNLRHFDYLKSINADYIEQLLEQYLKDPASVDDSWRYLFDGLSLGANSQTLNVGTFDAESLDIEWKALKLIAAYRMEGHFEANVNPIYPKSPESLSKRLGIPAQDLAKKASVIVHEGFGDLTLGELESLLQKTYCGTASIELGTILIAEEREWIRKRFEPLKGNFAPTQADRLFLLKRLTESEGFEKFLHTRYVAQKRFSIEGGESLVPALDQAIETATQLGAEEVVIGMAHRGRLNVMVNVFGKPYDHVFTEFDDNYPAHTKHGEGDVKYHKGHSRDFETRQGKKVHLSLGFNPSHLEFIGPVVIGMARAKQFQRRDQSGSRVLPILIHGDAAFAGQGVVYETLNASQVSGYKVGGTLHIVSNNQVGFTTDPKDARSTPYCTDLAKMLDAPIFHVNGDDPEAVWAVLKIATEFRYQFKKDVFIDLICYRKFGHNEGDEPSFTQPGLYKVISGHQTPRAVYASKLVAAKIVPEAEPEQLMQAAIDPMQKALDLVRATKPEPKFSEYQGPVWSKLHSAEESELFVPAPTAVDGKTLLQCATAMSTLPKGFSLHPKLVRLVEARKQTVETGKQIDWGNAELLAYASLLLEGIAVRMTGQDVCRGTFTHRHAVLFDSETGNPHTPMNQIAEKQAKLQIFNSHLSETAALGIEFGFSITEPNALVIWEAQFGDFANGAQVIIDQFFATSESKWHRASGLTLLLPHGYEGQGPEHSSARLERFLQLAGRLNIQVGSVTTPAQLFHILRRQVKRPFRKPLVLMSPKSLLRHPKVISDLPEFTGGHFQEVLDDPRFADAKEAPGVKKVLLCSGKVFFELMEESDRRGTKDVAILRLEQFYPWPEKLLAATLEKYPNATKLVFTQEEPRNMGAWMYFSGMWTGALGSSLGARFPKLSLSYVGRDICASPAVGSKKLHDLEQKAILERAFQE